MLTAYLFDKRRGKEIEQWADTAGDLGKEQVLWVDLLNPTEDEENAVREALRPGGRRSSSNRRR